MAGKQRMANRRILTLSTALGVLWIASVARVFYIQVVKSSYYSGKAVDQSVRRDVLKPSRGEVFDRSGMKLVANVDEGAGTPQGFRWSRLCPNGRLAGQVLGVVSRDGYGQSGLEMLFDRNLRGTDGWRYVRYDARKRYTPGAEDESTPPVDGTGVRLTLDSRVQEVVEHALERGVERTGAKQGVVIIVEPATGDIVAMANYPFFDPNTRETADREDWKNHAVAMVYEPGSAFKVITSAALLQEHRMRPADTVDGGGGTYQLPAGQVLHDTHPVGRVSFTDALAYSSNIAFAKMSTRLPSLDFYKYIRSFGFGMKTGTTLPSEESGRVQPIGMWSARSGMTIAFGHEISVTPLQMAMAFAAVANNGVLMRPRVVKAWVDANGSVVREEPPRQIRRVISDSTATELRAMMKGVVEYGTAADIRHPSITIAGKTGTAEKIDPKTGKYLHGHFHSSFIGMAPAEHPVFACLVMLDEPTKLKYGGQSAAPIFREILDRVSEERLGWPDHPVTWTQTESVRAIPGGDPVKIALAAQSKKETAGMLLASATSTKSDAGKVIPASYAVPEEAPESQVATSGSSSDRVMPDLHNATLRDALLRMKALAIEVDYQGAGKVREQDPLPGAPLKRGSHCRLQLGWTE
jgi:cell division protein FtsI (penicillin-binding protein 3)